MKKCILLIFPFVFYALSVIAQQSEIVSGGEAKGIRGVTSFTVGDLTLSCTLFALILCKKLVAR